MFGGILAEDIKVELVVDAHWSAVHDGRVPALVKDVGETHGNVFICLRVTLPLEIALD